MGGKTKATKPAAVFVDSGDILIMSGQSRLAYHAVPRILTESERPSGCRAVACVVDVPADDDTIKSASTNAQRFNCDTAPNLECFNAGFTCQSEQNARIESKCTAEPVCLTTGSNAPSQIFPLCQYDNATLGAMMNSLNSDMDGIINSIDWTPFEQFLSKRRINLNVRQVCEEQLTVKGVFQT